MPWSPTYGIFSPLGYYVYSSSLPSFLCVNSCFVASLLVEAMQISKISSTGTPLSRNHFNVSVCLASRPQHERTWHWKSCQLNVFDFKHTICHCTALFVLYTHQQVHSCHLRASFSKERHYLSTSEQLQLYLESLRHAAKREQCVRYNISVAFNQYIFILDCNLTIGVYPSRSPIVLYKTNTYRDMQLWDIPTPTRQK